MMGKSMKCNQFWVTLLLLYLTSLKCLIADGTKSLWGWKMEHTNSNCMYWRLNPEHSLPALDEFSVCVNIQKSTSNSPWTAFMYLHPNKSQVELGLGRRGQKIQTWLLGKKWSTVDSLKKGHWHSICISWSCAMTQPQMFIDGISADITHPDDLVLPLPTCSLAPGGTLTLGAAHYFAEGQMQVEKNTNLQGSITLFRVWGKAHSLNQFSTHNCIEGDILKWHSEIWYQDNNCQTVRDYTLKCAWSLYEVKMQFLIQHINEKMINSYDARELAHRWLRHVLPSNIYLQRVSVNAIGRFSETYKGNVSKKTTQFLCVPSENTNCKILFELKQVSPQMLENHMVINNVSRFDGLAHLNVIPSTDVGEVQYSIFQELKKPYNLAGYIIITEEKFLHIYPIEQSKDIIHSTLMTTRPTLKPADTPPPLLNPVSPHGTDTFFQVSINVTIAGSDKAPEDTLKIWLYRTLTSKDISVLNFQLTTPQKTYCLEKYSHETKANYGLSEESCVFQIHVPACSNIEETQRQIHSLLEQPYSNGSVRLDPENIYIAYINPGLCPLHTLQTRQGLYVWPMTPAQKTAQQACEADREHNSTRKCLLGALTNQAVWVHPDLQYCPTVVNTMSDLEHIQVTNETAEDVLKMIQDMMREHDSLDNHNLLMVLTTLETVLNVSVVTPDLGEVIINITSNILTSQNYIQPFTNRILNITETVGNKLSGFIGDSITLVAPALTLTVVNLHPENFYNLTFGVTSINNSPFPEIYINQEPFEGTVAFISLPSALQNSFPQNNQTSLQIQFQFYRDTRLFKDNQKEKTLNTYVVSVSINNALGPVEDMKEPVTVTLHNLDSYTLNKDVQCVYWNFNMNGGLGGWSPSGCWIYNLTTDYTTCMCDHLTHFGVLLDVSRTAVDDKNEKILTVITYIGCGVSSFFLGITLLTYSLLEKLRRDYPSQILLNLSIALFGLNLTFLINSWLSSFEIQGLCVAVAMVQHYFLLASFTWMFLEAVNMYFALVKVFNAYIPAYILKFCGFGWGIPFIICFLVMVLKQDAYNAIPSVDKSEMFCWVQDDLVFYASVVGYIGLVLLCNTSIFLVVVVQIRNTRVNEPAGTHSNLLKDLRGVVSLTLLLGLTWVFAFFTWGPAKVPFLYLFSIFNSLQGFFIFVFHCVMRDNVQKQWRIHLCFGRLKRQEYSDWSHIATVAVKPKPNYIPKSPKIASVRSNESNSTQSSSASSDFSKQDISITSPNLGMAYQQGLMIPREQLALSPLTHSTSTISESGGYEIHSRLPEDISSHDIYFKQK